MKRLSELDLRVAITEAMISKLPKCGSCDNWMKSGQCPLEKTKKPSADHPACKSFIDCKNIKNKDEV